MAKVFKPLLRPFPISALCMLPAYEPCDKGINEDPVLFLKGQESRTEQGGSQRAGGGKSQLSCGLSTAHHHAPGLNGRLEGRVIEAEGNGRLGPALRPGHTIKADQSRHCLPRLLPLLIYSPGERQ